MDGHRISPDVKNLSRRGSAVSCHGAQENKDLAADRHGMDSPDKMRSAHSRVSVHSSHRGQGDHRSSDADARRPDSQSSRPEATDIQSSLKGSGDHVNVGTEPSGHWAKDSIDLSYRNLSRDHQNGDCSDHKVV